MIQRQVLTLYRNGAVRSQYIKKGIWQNKCKHWCTTQTADCFSIQKQILCLEQTYFTYRHYVGKFMKELVWIALNIEVSKVFQIYLFSNSLRTILSKTYKDVSNFNLFESQDHHMNTEIESIVTLCIELQSHYFRDYYK